MAKMNGSFRYMFDAAPSISLLAAGQAAKTANFTSNEIALDTLDGYWTSGELADQTLAVIVNVTAVGDSTARTATITLTNVIATDELTLDDGENAPVTLVADTDFAVGVDDAATAANLAQEINDRFAAEELAFTATSAGNVVTVTNTLGTGGAITENETTLAVTAFAGNDETYQFDVEAGPVGFASSEVLGSLSISKPGQYVVLLDIGTALAVKPDAAALRLSGTLAGVGPSITAFSWIAAIQR